MRLNFTGRRKIDKQHARVTVLDDPPGSSDGAYFDIVLDLGSYGLLADARIVVEADRKLIVMRFELGTVSAQRTLSTAERRLTEFKVSPDDIFFRVKVIQSDGDNAGLLLAEADGLTADQGGAAPLLRICAMNLDDTPYKLDLVPTDPDLPTLVINTRIGGKAYAYDVHVKPVLMTAVVREVLSALIGVGDVGDDPNHWANKWYSFVVDVLGMPAPPEDSSNDYADREWLDAAVDAFAREEDLVSHILSHHGQDELSAASEIN